MFSPANPTRTLRPIKLSQRQQPGAYIGHLLAGDDPTERRHRVLTFIDNCPKCLLIRQHGIACQPRTNAAGRTGTMADDAARLVQFLATVDVPGGKLLADVTGTVLGKSLCADLTGTSIMADERGHSEKSRPKHNGVHDFSHGNNFLLGRPSHSMTALTLLWGWDLCV